MNCYLSKSLQSRRSLSLFNRCIFYSTNSNGDQNDNSSSSQFFDDTTFIERIKRKKNLSSSSLFNDSSSMIKERPLRKFMREVSPPPPLGLLRTKELIDDYPGYEPPILPLKLPSDFHIRFCALMHRSPLLVPPMTPFEREYELYLQARQYVTSAGPLHSLSDTAKQRDIKFAQFSQADKDLNVTITDSKVSANQSWSKKENYSKEVVDSRSMQARLDSFDSMKSTNRLPHTFLYLLLKNRLSGKWELPNMLFKGDSLKLWVLVNDMLELLLGTNCLVQVIGPNPIAYYEQIHENLKRANKTPFGTKFVVFRAHMIGGESKILESEEIEDCIWVSKEEMYQILCSNEQESLFWSLRPVLQE